MLLVRNQKDMLLEGTTRALSFIQLLNFVWIEILYEYTHWLLGSQLITDFQGWHFWGMGDLLKMAVFYFLQNKIGDENFNGVLSFSNRYSKGLWMRNRLYCGTLGELLQTYLVNWDWRQKHWRILQVRDLWWLNQSLPQVI